MPIQTGSSESRIGKRETRISPQRLPIEGFGAIEPFRVFSALSLAFLVFALREQIMSFRVMRRYGGQGIRLGCRKLRLQQLLQFVLRSSLSTAEDVRSLFGRRSLPRGGNRFARVINCTLTRTWSASFCTLPSRIVPTPSWLFADLREITRFASDTASSGRA